MYRAIVAHRIRRAWAALNARDADAVIAGFAPRFEYRFAGEHAIGGTRRTTGTMRAWFARIFRLFPTIRFTVEQVAVAGWPWRTAALVHVRVDAELDGAPYENVVFQEVEIRWGRITRILTLEDTQRLERALRRLEAAGVAEAGAPPIADALPAAA